MGVDPKPANPEELVVRTLDTRTGVVTRTTANYVIYALPKFMTDHVLAESLRPDSKDLAQFSYSPWVISNLEVDRLPPPGPGAPLSWDNVSFSSQTLGYVVATHQSYKHHTLGSVLTHYWPQSHLDPDEARAKMLDRSWKEWKELIVDDMESLHPGYSRDIRRVDVMMRGHAVIQPRVGFVWSEERQRAGRSKGRLHFAHSDISGLPIIEEAQYQGVLAAERVMGGMGKTFRSSLL